MELLGKIQHRKIYYLQIRNNRDWKSQLPDRDWIAFTIANKEDEELVASSTRILLENNVSYTCSAGGMARLTEDYIDEEICWMQVNAEEIDASKSDEVVVTTSHENFEEGFWFAAMVANKENFDVDKLVCLDYTKRKVRGHIMALIRKLNEGWLPSENEIGLPGYDD